MKKGHGAVSLLVLWVLEMVTGGRTLSTLTKVRSANVSNEDSLPESLFGVHWEPSFMVQALQELESDLCRNQTLILIQQAANYSSWAARMIDASAKSGVGILEGSQYQLGSFDECLSVRVPLESQYCLAKVQLGSHAPPTLPPAPTSAWGVSKDPTFQPLWPLRQVDGGRFWKLSDPLMWGVCLPAACSRRDVQALLTASLRLDPTEPGNSTKLIVTIDDRNCQDGVPSPLQTPDLIFIAVIGAFILLLLVATVYDFFLRDDFDDEGKSLLPAVLMSFSVRSNLKKLVRWSPSELHLDCVLGIKLYCMLLIVAGHGVVFMLTGPSTNPQYVQDAVRKVYHSYLLNGMLLVDSFLLVSGFLLTRLLLLELDRRRHVNFGLLYVLRYVRLTPSYLAVVAFYCTLLRRSGSGPLWPARMYLEQDRCQASWWANILYINNYVNNEQLCMFQSWYIAADTQLFMLAPFVIWTLWRWPTFGRILGILVWLASILVPLGVTWSQRLDPVLLIFPKEIWQGDLSGNAMYRAAVIKTHMRATSYCCGMFLGWAVHRFQGSERTISKVWVRILWFLAVVCGLASMFSVSVFYQQGHKYNALEAAIYASLHRLGWCLATSWLIFACVTGNGGPMQRLLIWRPIVPFSRLTYCAYLVNGMVVLHSVAGTQQPRVLTTSGLVMDVIAQVAATFFGALLLSLMFESPIHGLERILLKKVRAEERKQAVKADCSVDGTATHNSPRNQTSSQL